MKREPGLPAGFALSVCFAISIMIWIKIIMYSPAAIEWLRERFGG